VFQLTGGEIDYGTETVTVVDAAVKTLSFSTLHPELMSSNVTSFTVAFETYYDSTKAVLIATKADITVSLSMGGRTIEFNPDDGLLEIKTVNKGTRKI
jgi:hypothetical protein